jgi:hypothetical protein
MKYLLSAMLLVCCGLASAADTASAVNNSSNDQAISKCFKVRRLLKTDEAYYWADWKNTCPFTIDQVYVMVRFQDRARKTIGEGVWPLYFVLPGVHRVTRFSIPAEAVGFEFIRVKRITIDTLEALR